MKKIFATLLGLAFLGAAFDASAQMTGRSTGASMFGGSSNAFGSGIGTGMTGMTSFGSANGMNSFGSGMSGMNSFGSGSGMNSFGSGISGMGQQNGGFVGANTSGGFVGANNNTGTQGRMGSMGLGGMNSYGMGGMNSYGMGRNSAYGMGNRMMGQNGFGMGGYGAFGNQNSQQRQLVTAYRTDIEVVARPTANLSTSLTRQLRETPGVRSLSPLRATQRGRTLILEGAVATEHDKALIERMVRMEPGVDQVQNDLTVGIPSSPGTPATPAAKRSAN
jgi:osmotically-inducible protein OsmY